MSTGPDRKFDLEHAITDWRRRCGYRQTFNEQDLDEWERHLRDQIRDLIDEGESSREAFFESVRRLGDEAEAEEEYGKVYWGKIRRTGNFRSEFMWRASLFGSYIRSALVNLTKQKGYALANVVGLSVGLSLCLLIFLFLKKESGYDQFHDRAGDILRVVSEIRQSDGSSVLTAISPLPLAEAIQSDFPEIESVTRLTTDNVVISRGDVRSREQVLFADSSFFDVFSFPLLQGDAKSALDSPRSVVLSRQAADRILGPEARIGDELTILIGDRSESYEVTGIAEPVPKRSSITFDILLRFSVYPASERQKSSWTSSSVVTYVKIRPDADAAKLQEKLPAFVGTYFADRIADGRRSGSFASDRDAWVIWLQPLPEVHFGPPARFSLNPVGNPLYGFVLAGIGLVVLIIGAINFVILSVGRSVKLSLEVGLRKVMGAGPGQIRLQYWSEALLQSFLALLLAMCIAWACLPVYNGLAEDAVTLRDLIGGPNLLVWAGFWLLISLLAGAYPALLLARFQPASVLRGMGGSRSPSRIMRTLVVIQMTVTAALIICTLVISRQWSYIQSKGLGFDQDNVVVVRPPDGAGRAWTDRFREAAASIPTVQSTSTVNNTFSRGGMRIGLQEGDRTQSVWVYFVDPPFIPMLGLDILEGRDFREEDEGIQLAVVNETLVQSMGWSDPVGREMAMGDGLPIVGVVKDFHFQSLRDLIEPAVIVLNPDQSTSNILVKIRDTDVAGTLDALGNAWKDMEPESPFNARFLAEDVNEQYVEEARWNRVVRIATLWTMLIACTGLFGLAASAAASRTRESGIRKVLGASVGGLVVRYSREYVLLATVSFLIATPVAWILMQRWLEQFAYRFELSPWLFLFAGVLVVSITLFTVVGQSIRVALTKPVESLRRE